MKKANTLCQEIQAAIHKPLTVASCFEPEKHPATHLDEYMKEQYFTALFSVLICSEEYEEESLSYLIGVAEQAEFTIEPEILVKNAFAFDSKRKQDFAVSFRDEEIKYLLGLELYIAAKMLIKSDNAFAYIQEIHDAIELPRTEQNVYSLIYQVIEKSDLSVYTKKENYPHTDILQCYLEKLDFEHERILVVSNCLKEVRSASCDKSIDYIATVSFVEAHFISDYQPGNFVYVEKGSALGHFIAMVGGFSLGTGGFVTRSGNNPDFIRKWDKMDADEKRLITPKFKDYNNMRSFMDRDYYEDNTYEVCDILAEKSGVFYFIYNEIGAYNDPFAVISHPLDDEAKIRAFLNQQIDISRENEK